MNESEKKSKKAENELSENELNNVSGGTEITDSECIKINHNNFDTSIKFNNIDFNTNIKFNNFDFNTSIKLNTPDTSIKHDNNLNKNILQNNNFDIKILKNN